MLATSGIEDVVRVWAPTLGTSTSQRQTRLVRQVEGNQRRMSLSPQAMGQAPLMRRLLLANPNLLALLLAHAAEEE